MRSFSDIAAELAFAQVWQVTLVILGAGLSTRLGCRRRPHLAHLIWLVVLVKCLTPPLWSSPTGVFSWTMPRIAAAAHVASAAAPSTTTSLGSLAAPANDLLVDGRAKDAATAAPRTTERPWPASPIRARQPVSSWTAGRVARLLWMGWAVGALAYAGFALLMIIGTWRTIRASQVPCDETLAALLQTLAERLRVRSKSRLVLLSEPLGPMTFGWIRPTIIVPQALVAGRSAGDLEPLLAHELVHIRRGDAAVGLMQVAAPMCLVVPSAGVVGRPPDGPRTRAVL
jgi:beta-lactamase regulating signal transducer with metallopeptidase domain